MIFMTLSATANFCLKVAWHICLLPDLPMANLKNTLSSQFSCNYDARVAIYDRTLTRLAPSGGDLIKNFTVE